MDDRERFKLAALAVLAEAGVHPRELPLAGMQKAAIVDWLTKRVGNVFDKGVNTAADIAKATYGYGMRVGFPLAAVLPAGLGAVGGYGLARMTDIDKTDAEAIKTKEMISLYQNYIKKLNTDRERKTGRVA